MDKLLNKLKKLELQFETLKQNLKNESSSFRNSKEYKILHRSVSRCKKKIEHEETISSKSLPTIQNNSSPMNVVGLPKIIKKNNLPLIEKKINSPVIEKNSVISSQISPTAFGIENNLPFVRRAFTLAEKELLTRAKKGVAVERAQAENRSITNSELLAIEKAAEQPPTAYDEELLVLQKLYPVVVVSSPFQGEESRKLFVFGENESMLRKLDKYKLLFPNRWPKSQETLSIDKECELERVESELLFLKDLLKNNSSMEKNTAVMGKIARLTAKTGRIKDYLILNPVPTKPS